ncbi:MAG TPA: hypothetical protein VEE84_06385, partial [Burkholderiaceae bacterium]|nr:hypothetical protein [Burkholderiaceae bacterium]
MPQGRALDTGIAQVDANVRVRPARATPRWLVVIRRVAAVTCAVLGCTYSAAAWSDDASEPVPLQYRLGTAPSASALNPKTSSVTSLGMGQEFLFTLPASFRFESAAGINFEDVGNPLDRPRATYRYTWLSRPGWDFKVGLSTALDQTTPWQRLVSPTAADRLRV